MGLREKVWLVGSILGLATLACDDLALPPQPQDGGAASSSGATSSGQPAASTDLPKGAPANAIPGQIVSAFNTTLATWATVGADNKVDGFGWNLPLSVITTLDSAQFDSRVWMNVPARVTAETAITGFAYDHLPFGHIPPGIYNVPHWEFHVIFQDFNEIQALDCSDPTMPGNEIIPQPFTVLPPPDNCFPAMGIHAIDLSSPEFNKQRFTYSNLLVYYRGNGALKDKGARLTSYEPKATGQFLRERKSFTIPMPVPPPGALGREGRIPTEVIATYDAVNDTYIFTVGKFVPAT